MHDLDETSDSMDWLKDLSITLFIAGHQFPGDVLCSIQPSRQTMLIPFCVILH